MAVEIAIQQALDHGRATGRDRSGQTVLAAQAVRKLRPEWSEIEVLSAVDWVRSLAPIAAPAAR